MKIKVIFTQQVFAKNLVLLLNFRISTFYIKKIQVNYGFFANTEYVY